MFHITSGLAFKQKLYVVENAMLVFQQSKFQVVTLLWPPIPILALKLR